MLSSCSEDLSPSIIAATTWLAASAPGVHLTMEVVPDRTTLRPLGVGVGVIVGVAVGEPVPVGVAVRVGVSVGVGVGVGACVVTIR